MYSQNPFDEEMMRRRLQQQQPETPQFQQPAPAVGLPLYSGPEQAQWVPMGGGGQQQDMQDAGAGMASLIKRFQKPKMVKGDTAMPGTAGKFMG